MPQFASPNEFLLTGRAGKSILEDIMGKTFRMIVLFCLVAALPACGNKEDQAARDEAAKQAIQQGAQKEQKMMEGMVKGVETVEKKMTETKEETKK
jgi:hypothetical protein